MKRAGALARLSVSVFAGCLLLQISCSAWMPEAKLNRVMDTNGGSYFFFADNDLQVSLRIGPGKLFDWQFKNIGNQTMTLDVRSLYLLRKGDPVRYALWGEPVGDSPNASSLELKPGGFAKYQFPVRSKSPFWPFLPETEDQYQLKLSVRWGFRDYGYSLGFTPSQF